VQHALNYTVQYFNENDYTNVGCGERASSHQHKLLNGVRNKQKNQQKTTTATITGALSKIAGSTLA
jgi:hypothetical protein